MIKDSRLLTLIRAGAVNAARIGGATHLQGVLHLAQRLHVAQNLSLPNVRQTIALRKSVQVGGSTLVGVGLSVDEGPAVFLHDVALLGTARGAVAPRAAGLPPAQLTLRGQLLLVHERDGLQRASARGQAATHPQAHTHANVFCLRF